MNSYSIQAIRANFTPIIFPVAGTVTEVEFYGGDCYGNQGWTYAIGVEFQPHHRSDHDRRDQQPPFRNQESDSGDPHRVILFVPEFRLNVCDREIANKPKQP